MWLLQKDCRASPTELSSSPYGRGGSRLMKLSPLWAQHWLCPVLLVKSSPGQAGSGKGVHTEVCGWVGSQGAVPGAWLLPSGLDGSRPSHMRMSSALKSLCT